jgi:hypothetical protein
MHIETCSIITWSICSTSFSKALALLCRYTQTLPFWSFELLELVKVFESFYLGKKILNERVNTLAFSKFCRLIVSIVFRSASPPYGVLYNITVPRPHCARMAGHAIALACARRCSICLMMSRPNRSLLFWWGIVPHAMVGLMGCVHRWCLPIRVHR